MKIQTGSGTIPLITLIAILSSSALTSLPGLAVSPISVSYTHLQCEGSQYEDKNSDQRTDKYGFLIVLGRVLYVFYVDTAHFHTRCV